MPRSRLFLAFFCCHDTAATERYTLSLHAALPIYLNGDYLADALAAQVGGIGIAPGGNINYNPGHAIFEATHGTAPKYTDLDMVNPSSVILSGVLMFDQIGRAHV